MMNVLLYGSKFCRGCRQAKKFMEENNVSFEYFDIEADKQYFDDYIKYGFKAVPLLVVNDITVVGYDEEQYREKLGL